MGPIDQNKLPQLDAIAFGSIWKDFRIWGLNSGCCLVLFFDLLFDSVLMLALVAFWKAFGVTTDSILHTPRGGRKELRFLKARVLSGEKARNYSCDRGQSIAHTIEK